MLGSLLGQAGVIGVSHQRWGAGQILKGSISRVKHPRIATRGRFSFAKRTKGSIPTASGANRWKGRPGDAIGATPQRLRSHSCAGGMLSKLQDCFLLNAPRLGHGKANVWHPPH